MKDSEKVKEFLVTLAVPRATTASCLAAMERGKKKYGELDLASDLRDWNAELKEEIVDAINYFAIGSLKSGSCDLTTIRLLVLLSWQLEENAGKIMATP